MKPKRNFFRMVSAGGLALSSPKAVQPAEALREPVAEQMRDKRCGAEDPAKQDPKRSTPMAKSVEADFAGGERSPFSGLASNPRKKFCRGSIMNVSVPSSKSIANRALILAALTRGKTTLKGDFAADDIQIMIRALQKLGVLIDEKANSVVVDNDFRWRRISPPMKLNVGNSGTSMRFLTALCGLRHGDTVITGNARMRERPIRDLVGALRQVGVRIAYLKQQGFPPLLIHGRGVVRGGRAMIKGAVSSQFISAFLMISPMTERGIDLHIIGKAVSKPYIDLTLDVMKKFSPSFEIPGDASAAVYWWAFGIIHGIPIKVSNVPTNPMQPDAGFPAVARALWEGKRRTFDMSAMPDAALMLMAMAAAFYCFSTSYKLQATSFLITGIGTLRVKECDRIEAMATELRRIGAKVNAGKNWIKIWPIAKPLQKPVLIQTHHDHRIAMSFGILGTVLKNIHIQNPGCVRKTYPGFWKTLRSLEKQF